MELLNSKGIYPGVHYRDNTNYKMYKYANGQCPKAHTASEKIISLPLHLGLTDEDIDYIIDNVIEISKSIN